MLPYSLGNRHKRVNPKMDSRDFTALLPREREQRRQDVGRLEGVERPATNWRGRFAAKQHRIAQGGGERDGGEEK